MHIEVWMTRSLRSVKLRFLGRSWSFAVAHPTLPVEIAGIRAPGVLLAVALLASAFR